MDVSKSNLQLTISDVIPPTPKKPISTENINDFNNILPLPKSPLASDTKDNSKNIIELTIADEHFVTLVI